MIAAWNMAAFCVDNEPRILIRARTKISSFGEMTGKAWKNEKKRVEREYFPTGISGGI